MTDTDLLDELAQRLWDERHVVTVLLYRLTVTRLLFAADERRFVAESVHEVEDAIAELRRCELDRDETLRELAGRWTVDPDGLTLVTLARTAPPPYDHTFTEHVAAFRTLAAEIEGAARENRVLARSELSSVTAQLDLLTGASPAAATTYDANGQLDAASSAGGRLREVL